MSSISSLISLGGKSTSGRGPSSNSIADIIQQLEGAQKKANDANLERYNQGLAELQTGRESMRNYFAQAGSLIQDIGKSAVEEINRGSERSFALNKQGLISSGLHNTTIMGSAIRGTEDDRQRELRANDEQKNLALGGLAERQASAEIGASGSIASFMAARNDTGPDAGQYAGLIQDAAAAPQGNGRVSTFVGAGSPGFVKNPNAGATPAPYQGAQTFTNPNAKKAPPAQQQATGGPAAPGQQQRTFTNNNQVGSKSWENQALGGGGGAQAQRYKQYLATQGQKSAQAGGGAASGTGYIKSSGGSSGHYTTNKMNRPSVFGR